MLGNALSPACGTDITVTGNVCLNPCPEFREHVGNLVPRCDCEGEVPTTPADFVEWQSESTDYAIVLNPPTSGGGEVIPDEGEFDIGDTVVYRVYSYKVYGGSRYYSVTYNEINFGELLVDSAAISLGWVRAANVDGYRILRNVNGAGFNRFFDTVDAEFTDETEDDWTSGSTVTPIAVNQVNRIIDQTGSDNHGLQTTTADQSLRVGSVLNGYPAVRFDGVSDFLATAVFAGVPEIKFIGVWKRNATGAQEILDLSPLLRLESTITNQLRLTVIGNSIGGPNLGTTAHYFALSVAAGFCKVWLDGTILFNTSIPATAITKIVLAKTTGGFGAVDWFALHGNLEWTESEMLAAAQTLRAKYAMASPLVNKIQLDESDFDLWVWTEGDSEDLKWS